MRTGWSARPRKSGGIATLPLPPDLLPMEAKLVDRLPAGEGWQFEPKWDGFRCLAFRAGAELELRSKSGRSLTRFFPEIAALLLRLARRTLALDGELVIATGGALSFDALQLRLHPAESRVRRLAAETPATFILFDCLLDSRGRSLLETPLAKRREALEAFHASVPDEPALWLSPYTLDRSEAQSWLDRSGGALDGVVAKRSDAPYRPGERAMLKVKRLRTADCVVGGFRYERGSRLVGSLLLGLYNDEGRLDHVGYTSSIGNAQRPGLTRRLEALIAPPGFTGEAPGGPSRWSTARTGEWEPLRTELVAEVCYDQVTGKRFRHGTRLLRWRPDKAPEQCTFDQLERELGPRLLAELLEH
ncbi:MAG: ATP-dependent DNA ligase [Hyphomicrobiaceae bacterium]|nr:ATP-dependent DNA ligase [Hyphomicrobiaceae bacterium]